MKTFQIHGIKAEWGFHMRSFPTSNECDFKCVLANLRGNEAGVYTANKPSTSKMLPHMSFHSRAQPHPHLLPLLRGCTSPPGVLRVHLYSTSFTCREKCGNVELSKGLWKGRRADKFRFVTGVGNLHFRGGIKSLCGCKWRIQTVHFCCEIMDKRIYDSSL